MRLRKGIGTVSQLVSWKILGMFNGNYYPTNAWNLLTDPSELFPDAHLKPSTFALCRYGG